MGSERQIDVGGVTVGGGAPVRVQSMTTTRPREASATLDQIRRLAAAGCELVRVAVPEAADAAALPAVVSASPLPVIADIHFDWRLALAALNAGVAGVRINPGTIGKREHVRRIVERAAERRAAIRIGVNTGSLPRPLRALADRDPAAALVEAAMGHAVELESWGMTSYKLSVKSSSVPVTIAAYRALAAQTPAPLHVGVTEAGTRWSGTVKSAVGIGALLADGIGDTIRVSLTADPVEEVRAAWQILASLELRCRTPQVVSCPTCGRTEVDLIPLAEEVERRLQTDPLFASMSITVAVMGCRVNGPEEARHADYGIAAGRGEGVLFRQGRRVATVPEGDLVDGLLAMIAEAARS